MELSDYTMTGNKITVNVILHRSSIIDFMDVPVVFNENRHMSTYCKRKFVTVCSTEFRLNKNNIQLN